MQNARDVAKAVLRGKFIAIQSYFKKEEKPQIHSLTLQLKHLDKEQQVNSAKHLERTNTYYPEATAKISDEGKLNACYHHLPVTKTRQ